jgi:chitodextrinase
MRVFFIGTILGVALLWAQGSLTTSAQTAPPKVSKKAVLEWDAPTTNEDGTPLDDLAVYVLAVAPVGVDLATGGSPTRTIQTAGTETQLPIKDLVNGLSKGTYRFWVAARDTYGNQSLWSDVLELDVDPRAPGRPGNLRVAE